MRYDSGLARVVFIWIGLLYRDMWAKKNNKNRFTEGGVEPVWVKVKVKNMTSFQEHINYNYNSLLFDLHLKWDINNYNNNILHFVKIKRQTNRQTDTDITEIHKYSNCLWH